MPDLFLSLNFHLLTYFLRNSENMHHFGAHHSMIHESGANASVCVYCVCRVCIKYIVLCNQILSLETIPTFFDCVQFPVFHINLNGIGKTLDYSRNWCFVGVMLFLVDVPVTACHHWIYIHNCYGALTWHFDKQTPTEYVCVCVISRFSGFTDMDPIKLDINGVDQTFLWK